MKTAAIVIAIVGVVGVGWLVYDRNQEQNSQNATQQTQNQSSDSENTSTDDPYEGWESYNNATYHISFRYPTDWKVDDGPVDSPNSATRQEYSVLLKRNEEIKYNDTVNIEVLGIDLEAATTWYDNYFAQSSSNQVTKTTGALKGKQSVQYMISNSNGSTKLYLFRAENKTYIFSSINEELNSQIDTAYWTKFDKVFDSLTLD